MTQPSSHGASPIEAAVGAAEPVPEGLFDAVKEVLGGFRAAVQRHPERLFFAPGRVNLMGAHLDYNGGPVMPIAIDRGTLVAVARRRDRRVVLHSKSDARVVEVELDRFPDAPIGAWADYPLGVLREVLGAAPAAVGLDLYFGGNLPIGAGLSSSASICIATGLAASAAWELDLTRADLVRVALRAERGFVGVQCGIMDPCAVGHGRAGHVLWLDCKDSSIEHLPFDAQHLWVGVADSGVRRELARGEFNRRVEECKAAFGALRADAPQATCLRDVPLEVLEHRQRGMDPLVARRARHVLEELGRTFGARAALERRDWAAFGAQMDAAHESLRVLYEVSTPELDALVEGAREVPGVLGSRLVGAGFGGSTVILLESRAREALAEHLVARYRDRTGRETRVMFFRPEGGLREFAIDG
jgi:galactokinase